MIFTTNKRLTKTAEIPLTYAESPAMTFSHKYRTFASQPRPIIEKTPDTSMDLAKPAVGKKMKWGEPTWFLFHTLAEKVKPEYFAEVKKELLNIIFAICANLPCPNCANHASEYMKAINFDTITSKDQLRMILHRFHNEVNRRKGFPEFPADKLSEKYSKANTVAIIHYFMPFFEDKHASMRMIADDLHRSRIALQLKAWFNKNIGMFDL
jgi:hypothetical protein